MPRTFLVSAIRRVSVPALAAAGLACAAGPAGAQTSVPATATITAGGLNFINSTPSAIAFPPVTLDGTDKSATQTQVFNVSDATGSGAGWKISATSTRFTSGAGDTLPATAVTIGAAPVVACDAGSTCTPAANGTWNTYTLPAGATAPTASILYRAQANTGMGNQQITPTWALAVPGAAEPGNYTSTWTFTLASGPS